MPDEKQGRDIAVNRRAFHDYFVDDTYEAGIVLTGTEVKSLRAGRANLGDGYVRVEGNAAWLENVHISSYDKGPLGQPAPIHPRKLLLHAREISTLIGKVRQKGYTLIPLRLYLVRNRVKVAVGLCRGKKLYDKRQALAAADARREVERAVRG